MKFLSRSLRARLVIYFSLLSLVMVSVVAYVAFQRAREALTRSVFDRLEAVATLKEDELNRWVGDQSQEVLLIARLPEMRRYASTLISSEATSEETRRSARAYLTDYLSSLLAGQPNLQEIFILTDQGQVVFSSDPSHEGESHSTARYFIEGRWRTFVQNVYHAPTGRPTMTMATPLLDETGQRLGVLAAHLNLERMDRIILERASLGASGETYVVDRFHVFVSSDRFGRQEFPYGVHSQGIEAALQGQNGSGLYLNYRGIPVIGVYRWVGDRELALLAEMHQEEAFAPARQLAINIVSIGLVSACLLAVGVYLLAARLMTPIMALVAGARRVALGHLDQEVPAHGQDELGLLVVAFNAMQADLRHSRLQLEEYARTLEQRVAERTAELQQANVVLARRALQLDISNQVGRQITSLLNLDELLPHIVRLIRDRFGYYFVGIWMPLVAGDQECIALRAGVGPPGVSLTGADACIPMDAASIIVKAYTTGRYCLVNDVRQSADYLATKALPNVQAELALPLRIGEGVSGVLDIESEEREAFATDDLMVLQTLADQIAIAIHNAQLYQAEQTRRRFAESLEHAGRELSCHLDWRELPDQILQQLATVTPHDHSALLLRYGDVMQLAAGRGFPEDRPGGDLPIPEETALQPIIATGRPVLWEAAVGLRPLEGFPANESWLGVPLVSKDDVIGVIWLARRQASFDPDEVTLVSTFAGQAAIALENASLYDEIARFNEQLEQMVLERTEELRKAYQSLERLDKTKSDFIDIAAHELRTPLTLIRGYAQLLFEIEHEPMARPLIEGILAGEMRLHEIVDNLLDVSRITSEAMDVCKTPVRLLDILRRVCSEFKSALHERQLTLTLAGLEDLPVIQADAQLLPKVFHHLVMNAIKYTPDGGRITVTGKLIQVKETAPIVQVVVSDTGIGIDPAYHELIFEKFFQTGEVSSHSSGRTKFKGGGPGLGLAIARGIVMAHGGRIWVESEGYDEVRCPGSHFHVCLPVQA